MIQYTFQLKEDSTHQVGLYGAEDHMTEVTGCAVDFWKNMAPDPRNGTYDSYMYRDDLTDIIQNHDTSEPFFSILNFCYKMSTVQFKHPKNGLICILRDRPVNSVLPTKPWLVLLTM